MRLRLIGRFFQHQLNFVSCTYKAGHVIRLVIGILEINVDIFVLLAVMLMCKFFAPSKHFKGLLHYFQCIAQRSE